MKELYLIKRGFKYGVYITLVFAVMIGLMYFLYMDASNMTRQEILIKVLLK